MPGLAGTTTPEARFAGTPEFLGSTAVIGFNVVGPAVTPTPVVGGCPGDCDASGGITVDELVRGVNIALGILSLDACPCFDRYGEGSVTIDELIAAVNGALRDCT